MAKESDMIPLVKYQIYENKIITQYLYNNIDKSTLYFMKTP
jgi:hypothetical protein